MISHNSLVAAVLDRPPGLARRTVLALSLVIAGASLISCRSEPGSGTFYTTTKSADQANVAWSVSTADTMPFGYVAHIAVAQGRVFVLDQLLNSVTVLDTAGKFLASFGRKGFGPGEFNYVQKIAVSGDTVFVKDDRLHLFGFDGKVLATAPNPSFRYFDGMVATPYGLVFQHAEYDSPFGAPARKRTTQFSLYDLVSKSFCDKVSVVDTVYGIGESSYIPTPYGIRTPFTWSAQGDLIRTVGDSFHIIVQSLSGDTVRHNAFATGRVEVSELDRADFIDRAAKSFERPRRDIKRAVEQIGVERHFHPVVGALVSGADNSLMILRSDLTERPYRPRLGAPAEVDIWVVVDSTYSEIARMQLPHSFRPMHLDKNAIYGVLTREDDTTEVVRYNLPRR